MEFLVFILFIIALRITELLISKRNEKWLIENGAVEFGRSHYPLIVILHILFIVSLIIEYYLRSSSFFNIWFLFLYFLLVALKIWVISSLGKFWNTKIFRIADAPLITNGPYKFLKHPNYIIVIAEIVVIPLVFNLYYTAIIFSALNAVMLTIRIREENKALSQ